MNIFLKYFWGIAFIIEIVNIFNMYKRAKRIIGNNDSISQKEDKEIYDFIKWYGICFLVPVLFLQIFQLLGNYKTAFYVFLLDFNNPFYILAFISILSCWIGLIYLVIVKDGAEIMVKYNNVFGNMPKNKKMIKIFHGLAFIIVFIALLFWQSVMGGVLSDFKNMIE